FLNRAKSLHALNAMDNAGTVLGVNDGVTFFEFH
ncbi:MAG: hypothetical protein RL296_1115, partial [Actinomycetota bacterium]